MTKCPDWVAPYGKKLWPEVWDELDRRGRRLIVYSGQVAMFCQCLAQYRDITIAINKQGQVGEEDHVNAYGEFVRKKVAPEFQIQSELSRQASRLIKEMGLNEPLEEKTAGAVASLGDWLARARQGLEAGDRN